MFHILKKICLITASSLLLFSPLAAETDEDSKAAFSISNLFSYVEPVKKGEDEKKWFLNVSGGFTKKEGNTESTNTTYSGFAKYDDDHTVLKLNYSGSYGKLKGVVNDNRGTGTANFDYFIFWRLEFFSYTMSDYNRITLLKHRNGSGAGFKFYFIRNNYLLLDLSGAPIRQYEKYEEQPAEKEWRWSVRGRIELFPFDNNFSVRYYMYYIPAMKDKSNYRTIQDLYLYAKIAGAFGIVAGYRREFNTYDKKSFQENPSLKRADSTTYIQGSITL